MMIRPIDSFRQFIRGDGRHIYMQTSSFTGNLWVRANKVELTKLLLIVDPEHFVAYQPRAHGVDIYCIARKGLCETFTE